MSPEPRNPRRAYTHKLISHLDVADEFLVQGWALHQDSPDTTATLDVRIDGRLVSRLPAGTFRSDLKACGFGDGYHAFFFNPFDYLTPKESLVELRETVSGTLIEGGSRVIKPDCKSSRKRFREAHARSQQRWAKPNPEGGGAPELVFLGHLKQAAHFHPGLKVLEIGPGKGKILEALLESETLFGDYVGLDLCRPAVNNLHLRYAKPARIQFLTGDAARYPLTGRFDLAFASSLCDTLFPSFLPLAENLRRVMDPGGLFCFDLAAQDDRISIARGLWDGNNFLRLYSEAEVRRLLARAGFELLHLKQYTKAAGEHRVFVTALRPHPPARISFENL